jgi:hypothetical protein
VPLVSKGSPSKIDLRIEDYQRWSVAYISIEMISGVFTATDMPRGHVAEIPA